MRIKLLTLRYWGAALLAAILLSATAMTSFAQQITGTPGSPGATTTIDGKQLPPPDPKFGGVIKEKASESQAWWAPRVVPPKGAPNALRLCLCCRAALVRQSGRGYRAAYERASNVSQRPRYSPSFSELPRSAR